MLPARGTPQAYDMSHQFYKYRCTPTFPAPALAAGARRAVLPAAVGAAVPRLLPGCGPPWTHHRSGEGRCVRCAYDSYHMKHIMEAHMSHMSFHQDDLIDWMIDLQYFHEMVPADF